MKTTYKSIWMLALTLISSAALLTSCEDTDYPAAKPATGSSTVLSRFLFVNAAPGAPALNFLVENTPIAQAIAFGQAATTYATSPSGTIQLRAKPASGTIGGVIGSNDIIFRAGATNQTNFAAAANTNYTVFVTDTLNRPVPAGTGQTNPGGPQLVVATDPVTQTLTAGAGGVRFFGLAPDVSISTARISATTSTTGVPAAIASFTNRAFRVVTANTFTSVAAGTYKVDVFSGATLPNTTATAAIASSTITIEANKLYTIYLQGLNRSKSLSIGQVKNN